LALDLCRTILIWPPWWRSASSALKHIAALATVAMFAFLRQPTAPIAPYSLALVAVTGTGYQRSLLAIESDPYNF